LHYSKERSEFVATLEEEWWQLIPRWFTESTTGCSCIEPRTNLLYRGRQRQRGVSDDEIARIFTSSVTVINAVE